MPNSPSNVTMRVPFGRGAAAMIAELVIGAGFVFSMAINLPGHLSYDSVIQLLEGRTGVYSGWHPPVMSWLLGLSDSIVRGAGLYVLGSAAVLFAALASIPWLAPRSSWLAVPVALCCVTLPQVLLYQGIVWKDVLFANAAVTGFVLLAHAAVHWSHRPARGLLLGGSALCLTLAVLARQNGIVLVPFAGLALGLMARRGGDNRRAASLAAISFCVAIALCSVVASAALATRVAGDRGQAKQIRLLEFYDLNGALAANDSLRLPDLQHRDLGLLAVMRRDGRNLYSAARSDFLARSGRLQSALAHAPDGILHRSWMNYLQQYPLLYLKNRAAVFRWVFLTPDMRLCVPYVVGLRGPRPVLDALHVRERVTSGDDAIRSYGAAFVGTPVFSHATFLILALLEIVFLLWRRRTSDLVFACLLSAAAAFCFSFFFVSIACDYRYLYLLDLSALAALLHISASWRKSASRANAREADIPEKFSSP